MGVEQLRSRQALALVSLSLLVLTVPAHLWVAGLDLPLGGPNVYAGGLAVVAAVACSFVGRLRREHGERLYEQYEPIVSVVSIGMLLVVWAMVVYLATDTLSLKRLAQMVLGLGMLSATFICVTSPQRARILVLVIVLATFVSASLGFAIVFYGDPFLTMWLRIADNVSVQRFDLILTYKRIAGLSPDPVAFSYQLAAAVPLAFAVLLYGWPKSIPWRWILDLLVGSMLVVMVTAMVANSSRSMILGVLIGAGIVSATFIWGRRSVVRLVVVWSLALGWVAAFFNPTLGLHRAILPDVPNIAVEDRSVLDNAVRGSFEWKLARAYEALLLAEPFGVNTRLLRVVDSSTRPRPYMVTTALRYSLDYPLGTGKYYPSDAHIDAGLDERTRERVLRAGPHNQFLVVLVYYGFPGLILLAAFYLRMVPPLWPAFRDSASQSSGDSTFLAPAIVGAMAAYWFNSLLHNNGPFVGDWYHFILIGLVFALPRVLGTARGELRR